MVRKTKSRRAGLHQTLILLVLGAVARPTAAQEIPWGNFQEDPFWWSYIPQLEYIKTDVEVQQSSYKLVGGGVRNWDQLSVIGDRDKVGRLHLPSRPPELFDSFRARV
jgi:hypothetical protein